MLYGTCVEFIPSYNLLIHLVRPSPLLPELLPIILNNLSTPPSSSPNNGPALVLSILTTIFNVLLPTSNLRSTVFQNILKIISTHGLYEVLSPQLKNLDRWFAEWSSSDVEIRSILITVANIAEEASDDECVCLPFDLTAQLITDIFQAILQLPSKHPSAILHCRGQLSCCPYRRGPPCQGCHLPSHSPRV